MCVCVCVKYKYTYIKYIICSISSYFCQSNIWKSEYFRKNVFRQKL